MIKMTGIGFGGLHAKGLLLNALAISWVTECFCL
jgi:hypothetical protein